MELGLGLVLGSLEVRLGDAASLYSWPFLWRRLLCRLCCLCCWLDLFFPGRRRSWLDFFRTSEKKLPLPYRPRCAFCLPLPSGSAQLTNTEPDAFSLEKFDVETLPLCPPFGTPGSLGMVRMCATGERASDWPGPRCCAAKVPID